MNGNSCSEERFLMDVTKHRMHILHEDGVYRHLSFGQPGSSDMRFDLITYPGGLLYTGDMGSYCFHRLHDMLEFFRQDPKRDTGGKLLINPGYWGQKLEAVDRQDGYKNFSLFKFRECVRDYLKGRQTSKALWDEINDEILEPEFENGYEAHRAIADFNCEGFEFVDFFEYDTTAYEYRFSWCCYALVWAVQQYDAAKGGTA